MPRRLPPFRSIIAFEAAARHKSVKLAAQELNVTQSAISHQLRQFEEHIGTKLFIRSGRSLELTNSSLDVLPRLSRLIDEICQITQELAPDEKPIIRIGSMASPALRVLLHKMGMLKKSTLG